MSALGRPSDLYLRTMNLEEATGAVFRFGAKGSHASRTLMFPELTAALAAMPAYGSGTARGCGASRTKRRLGLIRRFSSSGL